MSKGIIIDVGFKTDIKDFINDIEKDLQKVDFDNIVGLSKEFDKQAKDVREQLSKLKREIDETINGKIPNDPSKQLQSLNEAVSVLATHVKELMQNTPNMDQKMLRQLDKLTSGVGQLSDMCTDAADAVKDLKKETKGSIQFVDKEQKKELEDTFKTLEKARRISEQIGVPKNQSGNKAYEDSEDALRDLISTYQVYANTMKEIMSLEGNTKLSNTDRTKELDKLNSSLVYSITNLSRMITTYSKLDKEWNKLSIFNNSKTTLEDLQYNLDEPLKKALDYISKRKAEIQQEYHDLGYDTIGYKELVDMFKKSVAKDDNFKIPVALGISTRATTLKNEAISIIREAQEKLTKNPLEVEVKLMSSYKSKANQKILNEIMDGLQNVDNEEIRNNVLSLIDKMSKGIDNALLFNVNVNTEKATQAVKDFVKDSKEELEQLNDILKILESVDDKNAKKINDSLSNMKNLIEEIKKAVDNKTLAFSDEEEAVNKSINSEIVQLTILYQGLTSIEEKVKEVAEAFKLMPTAFQFNLDEKTLESLDKLSDHEALSKLANAKSLISSAISFNNGSLIEIPDEQKKQLLDDIQKLSTEINTIFETKGLDNWSSKFLSSLNEISNKIKTLFGNNALNDMIEQWNMSDEHMISISGKDHIKERSALIADGKIYNSATHDQKKSSRFLSTTINEVKNKVDNIQSMIGIHSHGKDRIAASSIPQGDDVSGDLNVFYKFFKQGVEKQLTIALNDIELFDAKGFFESNNSIDFNDEKIRKLIKEKKEEIIKKSNENFYQFFEQFVSQYGSKDGSDLKKEIFRAVKRKGFASPKNKIKNKMEELIDPQELLTDFFSATKKDGMSLQNALRHAFQKFLAKRKDDFSLKSLGMTKEEREEAFGEILSDIDKNIKNIMGNAFGISQFDFTGKYTDEARDLATFNFRQETPRILKEALEGTGYKNNYQDFMKVFTTEEFIEQNPLGLSSGSLSDLFDNAAPTNFLQTLDKIVEDLKDIKNISIGDSLQGAFNVKIDNESVNRFAEEINRLIESIEKLPKIITDAFSNFESVIPKDPVKVIDKEIQKLNDDIKETEEKIKELENQLNSSNVNSKLHNDNIVKSSVDSSEKSNSGNNIYENILYWLSKNKSKIDSGVIGLPEQAMAANIFTGYATDANVESVVAGTTTKLVDSIIQNATEEINTLIHSHPEEATAAFSFDDIEKAAKRLKEGITYQIVTSLNDLAMIDISGFSEDDLLKISERMKELSVTYVSWANKYAVDEDIAYPTEFSNNFNENIQSLFDKIIEELKSVYPSIDVNNFKSKLNENLNKNIINLDSYDSIYESLQKLYMTVAKSFDIKDDAIFDNAYDKIDSKILMDFQERMLEKAIQELSSSGQLSKSIDFSDIYKKFSIEEFMQYSANNLLGKQSVNSIKLSSDQSNNSVINEQESFEDLSKVEKTLHNIVNRTAENNDNLKESVVLYNTIEDLVSNIANGERKQVDTDLLNHNGNYTGMIHTHPEKLAAMSLTQIDIDGKEHGDLYAFFDEYQKGVRQQIISALTESQIFDAGSFFDKHGNLFASEDTKKFISEEYKKFIQDCKSNFNSHISNFIKEYGNSINSDGLLKNKVLEDISKINPELAQELKKQFEEINLSDIYLKTLSKGGSDIGDALSKTINDNVDYEKIDYEKLGMDKDSVSRIINNYSEELYFVAEQITKSIFDIGDFNNKDISQITQRNFTDKLMKQLGIDDFSKNFTQIIPNSVFNNKEQLAALLSNASDMQEQVKQLDKFGTELQEVRTETNKTEEDIEHLNELLNQYRENYKEYLKTRILERDIDYDTGSRTFERDDSQQNIHNTMTRELIEDEISKYYPQYLLELDKIKEEALESFIKSINVSSDDTIVKSQNVIDNNTLLSEELQKQKENISELEKKKELLAEIFKLYQQNVYLDNKNEDNELEKYYNYLTGQLNADGKCNRLSDDDFDGLDKYLRGIKNSVNTKKWNKALNNTSLESLMSMIPNQNSTSNNTLLSEELQKLKEKHELQLKQLRLLEEQRRLLTGGTAQGSADGIDSKTDAFKTEGEVVDSVVEGEIKKLDELEKKLGEVTKAVNAKTEAFKNEGKVVGEVIDREVAQLNPLQSLESAYNVFKPFYDKEDLESEEGAKAALSYYNAYKEALASKVNKKDLKQFTIGKETDLFTGNYANYKKGTEELDLTGLNSQISKYETIMDKFNQPEVVSIINALTEAIQKLLETGNNSDKATKFLTELNKAINNLSGKTSANKIEKIATNLENFQKSIQALDISDSNFIQTLSSILEKGEELKALGEVLKSTKKQIDEAGKAVKAQDNLKQSQKYLEQYENDIRTAVNNKFGGENVLYQKLDATKDGVVQVTAMVQEGENAYKKYILTATNGSDLMVKATNDNAAALSKEIKQWKAYQKLKELAVPGARNLGEEGVTFTPDSANWNQLVDKAHEFGIEVKDIVKIMRNVDEIGQESFQIFTKLSRITVGMDSNGVLFQKDEVLDANKLINDFIKNVDNLQKSLSSSFKGDDKATQTFLSTLKEIHDVWDSIKALNEKGIISDEAVNQLSVYFDSFKTTIPSFSLDKISTDKKTPEFLEQLRLAETQLISLQDVLDKVNAGQMISNDDVDQIKLFISQVRTLYSTMGDKENKLADFGSMQKTLGKIADILAKNSAMSKDLKQRFIELSQEIHEFGENIPADKMKEFTNRFEALKTEMLESGKTGLSFFDGIWKRAKSMSQSFISMYLSLWDIIRYIRTGVNYIKEFDTALTEMRKVSDESVSSLKNFQKVSFDIANSVGTTAVQIQNSTADWMRLGESIEDAAKSAQVSNILLNVSEFESIDEATDSLVAMSSAYQDLEKIDIVDKLNEVGNNYAISTDGIATALQRSASALTTAGNDMDEAVALVTAGNAVVQDPDSVGAGMRTIALRLTGTKAAKEELEELGEETDGVATTVSKLRDTIMSATKVASNEFKGFDILDENGNYKSTYEIMKGISEIYQEIVETDKKTGSNNMNLLLETMAGKNRSNIAASILQNNELLESVYNSSANESAGSAEEELEKYLDSIEGKIAQFKNEVQEFWYNLISSETIKGFIDFGTKAIDILGDITDFLGEIETLATVAGVALGVHLLKDKSGGRAKVIQDVKSSIVSQSSQICHRAS